MNLLVPVRTLSLVRRIKPKMITSLPSQNIPQKYCCYLQYANVKFVPGLPFASCCFHTSNSLYKTKAKGKQKSLKLEEILRPNDVSEYIDLEAVKKDMVECLENLKTDYITSFQIGNDVHAIEKLQINLENEYFDLSEVAMISKPKPNLVLIDLTDFPEAVNPTIKSFSHQNMYNLIHQGQGTILRVNTPLITAETRTKLVKDAKIRMNKSKDELRIFLVKYDKKIKQQSNIPETTARLIREQMIIYVKHYSADVERIFKAKEKDLLPK